MRNRITKALTSAVAATALALAMTPAAAFAATTAGTARELVPQASTVKIWVMDSKDVEQHGFHNVTKYSYNKKGFVASDKVTNSSGSTGTTKYSYKNDLLKSIAPASKAGARNKQTFSYDKKGRLKKYTRTYDQGTDSASTSSLKYSYDKKGRLSKATASVHSKAVTIKSAIKYKCDKKGRITKMTLPSTTYTYSYGKDGNVSKKVMTRYTPSEVTYDNAYKYSYEKGKLTEIEDTYGYDDSSLVTTTTVAMKQISVPKKHAAAVKRQQWEIVNSQIGLPHHPVYQ